MSAAFVAALAFSVVPAYAHHSFAAMYVEDKTEMDEGELMQCTRTYNSSRDRLSLFYDPGPLSPRFQNLGFAYA